MKRFLYSSAIAAVARLRLLRYSLPAVLTAGCLCAFGGEAYFTGFENFTTGDDKIIGTESWVGSYAGAKLHAVLSEAEHGVVGIGNAAVIGGYATTITKTANGSSVYVAKAVNLDPVALNEEVATFSVVFGIKDSTGGVTAKRDNFEFLIYNQSNVLLAGVQFDNSTMDTSTGSPRRLIYRLSWNAATSSYQYVLTGYNFLPAALETLTFRINYNTNVWTASLSDVPIFENIPFHTGTATRNLGSVMARMVVSSTTASTISPGDNYMLFDDYTVRTDALTPVIGIEQPAGTALASGSGTLNFGSSLLGSPVPLTVTIKNEGEAPLTGLGFKLDGTNAAEFSFSAAPAAPIAVGGSATFDVTFTPSGTGSRVAALHVASNDPFTNPFDISLAGTGLGVPEIAVEQPAGTGLTDGAPGAGFGNIALGANASKTFTIKNTGTADLTGLAVAADGANAADFTVTASPASSLPPGGNTTFTVRFKPAAAGSRTAAIHIASNDANENPFDVTLTGTGIGNPEIEVRQPSGTNLTDGVSSKSFGSVAVKSKVAKTFTIRNTGTAILKNLAITKNGKHAKNFTVTKPLATSLSPGASTTFKVTFKPSAKGTRKAAIHVASDDGNENPFDIALTGKGVAAKSSASPVDSNTSAKSADKVVSFASTIRISDGKYACITIPRIADGEPGQESVEVSSNLVDWFSGPSHTKVLKDTAEVLKVRDKSPVEPGNKRFIRLKNRP